MKRIYLVERTGFFGHKPLEAWSTLKDAQQSTVDDPAWHCKIFTLEIKHGKYSKRKAKTEAVK